MPVSIEVITAILSLLLGIGIKSLIDWRKAPAEIGNLEAEERKRQAEAWVLLVQSFERRIDQLTKRITDMECQINDLIDQRRQRDQRIAELEAKVAVLERELDEWRAGRRKHETGLSKRTP